MKRILLAAALAILAVSAAKADGIIMPRPEPWMPPNPQVNIKYHYVDVEINDPVALTKIDQAFVNPFGREIEADYLFPIPEGAAISRFVAWLGGHKMEAELLDAAQARKIYEDIVRRRKDPALLEYAAQGMYRLRIYPIPANGEVRIQIEYEQMLESENGTVEYAYPLNTEKYSGSNLDECKVDLRVSSFDNLGSLYCPTHPVAVERAGEKSFQASYRETNVKPNSDIIFYFTRQTSDFGFQLLSYREPGHRGPSDKGKGFFLGILSPPFSGRTEKIDKNVIFVLDSSGSMKGEKMQQAIDALKFCLRDLNDGDRFNVIDYDDVIRPCKPELVEASKANISDALSFADLVEASGGTNIFEALASACKMIPVSSDPSYVIFLTDGLPTVGNTDIQQIITNTTTLNEGRARLFAFGVGYDVNTNLLDKLSEQNHGLPEYVIPEENIEVKVSRFASKISHPALTNLALSFNPKQVHDVYPSPTPDLFYGSEIIFTGRFDEDGASQAVLRGKIGDKEVTYEFPVAFGDGSSRQEFIPLLWANRRIGYLLQEMRLHGTNEEFLAEVIELSKKYGIITEYTSFLVTGDEASRRENIAMDSRSISGARKADIDHFMAAQEGESAVRQSRGVQLQAQADKLAGSGVANIGGEEQRFSNVSQVGAQAFFQVGNNWIQGDLTGDKYDMQIERYSKAYFQLLDQDPSLGRYLGLGSEVRLKIGTQVVQIADTGKETLTDEEMGMLFP